MPQKGRIFLPEPELHIAYLSLRTRPFLGGKALRPDQKHQDQEDERKNIPEAGRRDGNAQGFNDAQAKPAQRREADISQPAEYGGGERFHAQRPAHGCLQRLIINGKQHAGNARQRAAHAVAHHGCPLYVDPHHVGRRLVLADGAEPDAPARFVEKERQHRRADDHRDHDHNLHGRDLHDPQLIDFIVHNIEHRFLIWAKYDLRQIFYDHAEADRTKHGDVSGCVEKLLIADFVNAYAHKPCCRKAEYDSQKDMVPGHFKRIVSGKSSDHDHLAVRKGDHANNAHHDRITNRHHCVDRPLADPVYQLVEQIFHPLILSRIHRWAGATAVFGAMAGPLMALSSLSGTRPWAQNSAGPFRALGRRSARPQSDGWLTPAEDAGLQVRVPLRVLRAVGNEQRRPCYPLQCRNKLAV